jgi:preprotein translocase subunit SecE
MATSNTQVETVSTAQTRPSSPLRRAAGGRRGAFYLLGKQDLWLRVLALLVLLAAAVATVLHVRVWQATDRLRP